MKKYKDKDLLYDLYWNKGMNQKEIAKECNTSKASICRSFKEFNIKKKSRSEAQYGKKKYQQREWLELQYITLKKSTLQIANENDFNERIINYWLEKHNIPRRSPTEAANNFHKDHNPQQYKNRDWLLNQYQTKTMMEIGELCGISFQIVDYWLEKLGISKRDLSESQRLKKERKFYNEEWLRQKYIDEELSVYDLVELCNCGYGTLLYWLNKFNIPIRNRHESAIIACREKGCGWKKGHIPWHKGKTAEEDNRIVSGKEHPNWKGGISSERDKFRSSKEWKRIKRIVYKRDKYTCQYCERVINPFSFDLMPQIHHIISFDCKILRLVLSNLVLLCNECHYWVHSKKNKKNKYLLKQTKKNIIGIIEKQLTGTLLEFIY